MDEFQRFKYLLDIKSESDIGMLANKFFHSKDVRMLLLSATPYKMYCCIYLSNASNKNAVACLLMAVKGASISNA